MWRYNASRRALIELLPRSRTSRSAAPSTVSLNSCCMSAASAISASNIRALRHRNNDAAISISENGGGDAVSKTRRITAGRVRIKKQSVAGKMWAAGVFGFSVLYACTAFPAFPSVALSALLIPGASFACWEENGVGRLLSLNFDVAGGRQLT